MDFERALYSSILNFLKIFMKTYNFEHTSIRAKIARTYKCMRVRKRQCSDAKAIMVLTVTGCHCDGGRDVKDTQTDKLLQTSQKATKMIVLSMTNKQTDWISDTVTSTRKSRSWIRISLFTIIVKDINRKCEPTRHGRAKLPFSPVIHNFTGV